MLGKMDITEPTSLGMSTAGAVRGHQASVIYRFKIIVKDSSEKYSLTAY